MQEVTIGKSISSGSLKTNTSAPHMSVGTASSGNIGTKNEIDF